MSSSSASAKKSDKYIPRPDDGETEATVCTTSDSKGCSPAGSPQRVAHPRCHMPGGHVRGGVVHMPGLVIEEEIGLELAQEFALGQAAQEQGLVHVDAPVHQGADGTLMRGRATRRDQRRADAHAVGAAAGRVMLQGVQSLEQG